MTKAIVLGAMGRLGSAIASEIKASSNCELSAVKVRESQASKAQSFETKVCTRLEELPHGHEVVVDATRAESLNDHLTWLSKTPHPFLLAATGYTNEQEDKLKSLSQSMPILIAPNLSLGVAVLMELLEKITQLAPSARIQVTDVHHVHKKDAPSGTAKAIVQTIQNVLDEERDIPVESRREGEVIGEHAVSFQLENEEIVLKHSAKSRDIFSKGAVRAIQFLASRSSGFYTMKDLLSRG